MALFSIGSLTLLNTYRPGSKESCKSLLEYSSIEMTRRYLGVSKERILQEVPRTFWGK